MLANRLIPFKVFFIDHLFFFSIDLYVLIPLQKHDNMTSYLSALSLVPYTSTCELERFK